MKIAIVGTTSHKDQAPSVGDGWEVWGLNKTNNFPDLSRFTKWFDLHDLDEMYGVSEQAIDPGEYLDWLKDAERDIPVVLFADQIEAHQIPNAEPFDTEPLVRRFGSYFTNSISWILGYAITMRPDAMGLYGVDMEQAHEYAWERPSVEYMIGWARGANIPVEIPKESSLLTTPYLYGVDQKLDMSHVLRRRLESYRERAEHYRSVADRLSGAGDETENLLMMWGDNDDRRSG